MSRPVLDRDQVRRELVEAPSAYRALIDSASSAALRQRTAGTRWTNREMVFHLMFGYVITRSLLPLVRLIGRMPPTVGRGFAAGLDVGARPFHVVNYLGSVIGGRLLSLSRMARLMDRTCAALVRTLDRASARELARWMPFPQRWDPFFTSHMTVLDVYHYPLQHLELHSRQLTLNVPPQG